MKAYELLSTPDKWTKNSHAREQGGEPVDPFNPIAVCWCLEGALINVYGARWLGKLIDVESRILCPASLWNDSPSRNHAEVVAVLKELDI